MSRLSQSSLHSMRRPSCSAQCHGRPSSFWIYVFTFGLLCLSQAALVGAAFPCPDVNCECVSFKDESKNKLQNITCNATGFLDFPNYMKEGADVHMLNLRGNEIGTIHDKSLQYFTNLVELDVSYNKITFVTENAFSSLTILQYLNLEGNDLTLISPALFEIQSLISLNLASNPNISFPEDFKTAGSFSYLDISHSSISIIPANLLKNLGELKHLDLSHNSITSLPTDVFSSNTKLEYMNYHVWNEAWIARSDLDDKGMSGWQAFDATPQETSDVIYNVNDDFTRAMWTCGPCPVAAVKKGICNVQYDTGFVFSEVNADKIYWTVHPGGVFEKKKVETGSVGKGVYTRDPKKEGNEPWKITHEYKHEEGSKLEREAVKMAIKTARLKRDESTGHYESLDIECKLEHKDNINIGDDVNITFIITNKGVHKRTLQEARITVRPMTYTGETGEAFFVKDFEEPSVLNPKNKGKKLSVTMKMSDYLPHRKEQDLFRIEGRAYIPAENSRPMQNMYEESDFSFDLPALEIKGPRDGTLGETMDFTAGLVNPLNIPLTGCSMAVESSGFKDLPEVPQPDVAPGALYEGTFRLETIPAVSKHHIVIFEFNSRELQDIMGRKVVRIDDDEDED